MKNWSVKYGKLLALAVALVLVFVWVQARTFYPRQWHRMSSAQLFDMGQAYADAQKLDSAVVCFTIVSSRLDEATRDDDIRNGIRACYKLGNIYQFRYYNYQKAADCLLQGKQAAVQAGDSALIALLSHELGCLYLQYESAHQESDFAQSITYLEQACRNAPQGDPLDSLYVFNLITTGLQFNQVPRTLGVAHDYCQRQRASNSVTDLCQAAMCINDKNPSEALVWIDRALKRVMTVDNAQHARLTAVVRIIKCKLLDQLGRDSESLAELDRYEQIVRRYNFKEGVPDIYDQKYHFYLRRGNEQLASLNRLRYLEAVDSLSGVTQLPYLIKASSVFDLQKATEEVRLQEERRVRLTQTLWMVTIAALVFLGMLVMLYRRNRQLKERNQALYEQSLEQLAIIDEARRAAPPVQQPLPTTDDGDEAGALSEDATTGPDVDDAVLQDIYQRIKAIMESAPEVYDESFSMARLHEMVGSNTKYISRAIGQLGKTDFKSMLSQYRIREACRRMNDVEHYGQYTIEAIAKSVGVTSRTSFIQNFKRQTGLTPSAYLKLAHEKSEEA